MTDMLSIFFQPVADPPLAEMFNISLMMQRQKVIFPKISEMWADT